MYFFRWDTGSNKFPVTSNNDSGDGFGGDKYRRTAPEGSGQAVRLNVHPAKTSNQHPATSNQQPATSNKQPATSNKQPAKLPN
ncbi:MAG: hypothetical protein R6U46_12235 [Marinilabilia sp.]